MAATCPPAATHRPAAPRVGLGEAIGGLAGGAGAAAVARQAVLGTPGSDGSLHCAGGAGRERHDAGLSRFAHSHIKTDQAMKSASGMGRCVSTRALLPSSGYASSVERRQRRCQRDGTLRRPALRGSYHGICTLEGREATIVGAKERQVLESTLERGSERCHAGISIASASCRRSPTWADAESSATRTARPVGTIDEFSSLVVVEDGLVGSYQMKKTDDERFQPANHAGFEG